MTLRITRGEGYRIAAHSAGRDLQIHNLTLIIDRPLATCGDLSPPLAALAAALTERDLRPLQTRVHGAADPQLAAQVVAMWRATRTEQQADPPLSYVGNQPCVGGLLAGIQILAAAPRARSPLTCQTVVDGEHPCGCLLTVGDLRIACLTAVTGVDEQPDALPEPRAQMDRMFARAVRRIDELGLAYPHVARTWIYLRDLLDDYDALNASRTAAYRDAGLIPADIPPSLPASTGIQGHHATGSPSCFLDLIAVARRGSSAPLHRPLRTAHQCEAAMYGSFFSRGVTVDLGGLRLLFVSGTASINAAGETVHRGAPAAQILETYAAVETVLAAESVRFAQVVSSVAFCKDPAAYRAFQDLRSSSEIPDLPAIAVQADICRDDLLFELEPTAVV